MMRQLIIFICVGLIVGLSVGFLMFRTDFQPERDYPVEGNIVQVYIKSSNTSVDSGVAFKQMLSYVFFVNVTNLSDSPLSITQARIHEASNIIAYRADFTDSEDYLFYPNTSRLVAFSQVNGLYGLTLEAFNHAPNLDISMAVSLSPTEGKGHGGFVISTPISLEKVSGDEYVYNRVLAEGSYAIFGGLPISAWFQQSQIS